MKKNINHSTVAGLVACALLSVGTIVGQDASPDRAALDAELQRVEDLKAEIEDLQEKIKAAKSSGSKNSKPSDAKDRGDEMIGEAIDLEQSIQEKEFLVGAYRSGFYASSTIPVGTALGSVTLLDGSKLSNASFSSATKLGAKIKHSGGVAVMMGDDLPDALKGKVTVPPYDDELAFTLAALQAEKPKSLVPGDVIKEKKANAESERLAARKREYEEALARNNARREARMAKGKELQKEIEQGNEDAKIGAARLLQIENEIQALFKKRGELDKKLNREKRDRIKTNQDYEEKVVKADPKVHANALNEFDREITKYENEITVIDDKITLLNTESRALRSR